MRSHHGVLRNAVHREERTQSQGAGAFPQACWHRISALHDIEGVLVAARVTKQHSACRGGDALLSKYGMQHQGMAHVKPEVVDSSDMNRAPAHAQLDVCKRQDPMR